MLVVAGLAWFVLGIVVMHGFDRVDFGGSVLADAVFHASGLWLAAIGVAMGWLPVGRGRVAEMSA